MYFNLIHFIFDTETRSLIKKETFIEGPIAVCDYVYEEFGICDLPVGLKASDSLIPNFFKDQ